MLSDSRRAARATPGGDLIPLAEQDRTRWDSELIAEGTALITAAMARSPLGPYQPQAAIAATPAGERRLTAGRAGALQARRARHREPRRAALPRGPGGPAAPRS